MSKRWVFALGGVVLAAGFVAPADAQTLSERIQQIRKKEKANQVAKDKLAINRVTIKTAARRTMTAKQAIQYISTVADLPIVINWKQLEAQLGVTGDEEVELIGRNLSVQAALKLVVLQLGADEPLVLEPTEWYVQIMTQRQANQKQVIRTYPIGDLLFKVPRFTNAPKFDLESVIGGEAGESGNIFEEADGGFEEAPTKADQAEAIIELIKETVEPEIWGEFGSIKYWNESLIIRAPAYVHRQIGR